MSLPRLFKPLKRFRAQLKSDLLKQQLESWFESPAGQRMLTNQSQLLQQILSRIFGYHLLYSGDTRLVDVVKASSIKYKVFLNSKNAGSQLCSNIHSLPIQTNSTDLVILQHSLDNENDPFQILREASRVILPNGSLVVIGFNPLSLWGIWKLSMWFSVKPPWTQRFISPYRLSEWLDVLDFDVIGYESASFVPPISFGSRNFVLNGLDSLLAKTLPQRGGFYLLVAKKRVSCITPIQLQKVRRRGNILPIPLAGKVSSKSNKTSIIQDS